ncbi:hypothetical protein [Nocardioides antri]|uniref:Uncharacterized protein n=1 Tax=Nocardioides antri TaxID=2607659 RepID=A0A5B1M8P6_9ACTN|nr:hypothetical protein [Nocardioides antri]KAA1429054.1 hypothetical protein F0U47_02300 [Nocardioides antri]
MTPSERWVADPSIGWRILLTATLPRPPQPDVVTVQLEALATSQGWPPPPAVRAAPSVDDLRRSLVAPDPAPLLVGICGNDLVLSAHHGAADGLALLQALEQLGLATVRSTARGVGDRPAAHGVVGTVARRLREAALHPPATITPAHPGEGPGGGDVMADVEVEGSFRTAALVHAAVRAIEQHEAGRGRRAHRVAVAVGASRDPEPGDDSIADRSALLRLLDVERLDLLGIERALREAQVETPPVAARRRPWTPAVERATTTGMRMLARRLGSTLLVSHLGEVSAPHVDRLSFHPVTAGGTGISLGAVGHRGRTVLTLRARAADWDADGLERLLEAVGGRLA